MQRRVLRYVLLGESKRFIAQTLGRAEGTIHSLFKRIYVACGVHSRRELMAIFVDRKAMQLLDDGS